MKFYSIKIPFIEHLTLCKVLKIFSCPGIIFHYLDKLIMEVFSMGVRNWFKKSSKLFDKEGFYIVLFISLCIVAVAAVYISRNNASTAKKTADGQKAIEQREPVDEKELVDSSGKSDTVPVIKPPVSSNTSSTSTANTKKPTTSSTTKNTTSTSTYKLALPVEGDIKKTFSKDELEYSETMGQWETHEGIDIASDIGSEVKAAQDGKVVEIRTDDNAVDTIVKKGYGVSVVIEHSNGIRTVYSNLADSVADAEGKAVSALRVKKGDSVKKGQVIGVVGDTAVREMVSIEGSHLHFSVLKKNKNGEFETIDPQTFLK